MGNFLEILNQGIKAYNEYVGGYLILALLLPTGIYFTFKLRFLQVRGFWHAIRIVAGKYSKKDDKGDINHFKALTTALSATVGTGNIVGVALAIHYGGPGAIFWMWVTGFFGMMIKMVECTLAQKFRKTNADGSVSGGPMYYMEMGLKDKLGKYAKWLSVVFASAAILCSMGTGNMAQSNSMSDVLLTNYNIPVLYTGLATALLVLLIVVGGLKRIAEVTSRLVPFMAIFYFIAAITVVILHLNWLPGAFALIFKEAFSPSAAGGGIVGSAFIMTLTWGVRRGLFSNEAGQGSAPMAHAAAKTPYPMREGLVASLEPFVDTLFICTLTAIVIIMTGAYNSGIAGVGMTVEAFRTGLDAINLGWFAPHIVAAGLLLFAFSTIVSWSYYGTRASQYLFGDKAIKPYYYVYCIFV
ncbi:MAG: sodium:alanine symporter family protein, partial [Bacteroidales bacterium]|nr:sodium:alanine symporter family protein [Bacteroidales bacterium]